MPLCNAEEVWGREGNRAGPKVEEKKVEPNFGLSGALAEETNTVNNVALVYTEPPEAAHPTQRWRLYTFKGGRAFPSGRPLFLNLLCSSESALEARGLFNAGAIIISGILSWVLSFQDAHKASNSKDVSGRLCLEADARCVVRGSSGRAFVHPQTEELSVRQGEASGGHPC